MLKSAVSQSRTPEEIVVVDDCRSDATREIVSSYSKKEFRLIARPSNRCAGAARNTGVRTASREPIAFLDSGDEWILAKLEKQVALIKSAPRPSFVACASSLISAAGVELVISIAASLLSPAKWPGRRCSVRMDGFKATQPGASPSTQLL